MKTLSQPKLDQQAVQGVVDHVARYRLTVFDAVRRIPPLRARGNREVRLLLRRMVKTRLLGRTLLYGQRYYYHLGPASAAGPGRMGPLSQSAKVFNYALLAFCCLDRRLRRRLVPEEIERHVPELFRPGLPSGYYVDAERARFGLLRVDTGGRGRWDRLLVRCRDDLDSLRSSAGLNSLAKQGALEVTLITPTAQKASRLGLALRQSSYPWNGALQIVVMPELLNLIAPIPLREEVP